MWYAVCISRLEAPSTVGRHWPAGEGSTSVLGLTQGRAAGALLQLSSLLSHHLTCLPRCGKAPPMHSAVHSAGLRLRRRSSTAVKLPPLAPQSLPELVGDLLLDEWTGAVPYRVDDNRQASALCSPQSDKAGWTRGLSQQCKTSRQTSTPAPKLLSAHAHVPVCTSTQLLCLTSCILAGPSLRCSARSLERVVPQILYSAYTPD